MRLYLGSDSFEKDLCHSGRVFILSSIITDSFVRQKKKKNFAP